MDIETIDAIKEFLKSQNISEDYDHEMYGIWQEPGNENLSPKELYDKANGEELEIPT